MRASRSGSSRQARCGANRTRARVASTNPAAPIPTATTSCAARSSCTTSTIVASTAAGAFDFDGVSRRARASTLPSLVDDAGGDLRAADVDADGEGHGRRARSAAPMRPASLPRVAPVICR